MILHNFENGCKENDKSAIPDCGNHRQIIQNWRKSVTTWRWKMMRYRQAVEKRIGDEN